MPARPWTPVPRSPETESRPGDPAEEALVRVPVLPAIAEFQKLKRELRRPDEPTSASRIRRRLVDDQEDGADLNRMAEMFTRSDGGSLRTFTSPLGHERTLWPSFKSHRVQHCEGVTQERAAALAECSHRVLTFQTEGRRFRFKLGGRLRTYTCDVDVLTETGREVWELKKSAGELQDPDYLLTLAGVAEICRRVGYRFRLIMASDLFETEHHRSRVELFASRRFVTVGREHLNRLERHAHNNGRDTDHGTLVAALDPSRPRSARAVVQGLVARRRVEIDLSQPVHSLTPVRIH